MIDVIQIIKQFYTTDSELYNLLLKHSSSVANKALEIAEDAKLSVDKEFIYEGAMLHDIGIYKTYAPSIYCNGTEKYISHGVIGAEILRSLGLEAHARISERHTGSGLTATEIASARLPLPIRDMLPVTVEERLICYADKFYSKSKPDIELSIDMIEGSLSVYGEQVLIRFRKLNSEFNPKNAYFK